MVVDEHHINNAGFDYIHIDSNVFNAFSLFLFPGNFVLCAPMVVEKLGSWKDPCSYDGPGHWSNPGCGKTAEKETLTRLPLRQPETSQLVGLQIFLL
jgi:hypothetical protein